MLRLQPRYLELPEKRRSKNENRIANKLRIGNNRVTKSGRPPVADGQYRGGEESFSGGGPAAEEDREDERQDEPKTRTRSPVIHSNTDAQTIGKPRGDIVWMAVMELVATRRHVNANMFFKAEHTELLRAKGLAAMGQIPEGTAHKVELMQSVSEWLKENEEQKGGSGGVYVIRPGKWKQMKDAKKKLIARRGGVDALVATVTLLSAQGKATMQK